MKREGDICTVKARITPEHKVRKTPYKVTLIFSEKDSVIQSVQCQDCAASAGGCKHAIAFLSWVHRRSEEPATTSIKCYWSKSKLSSVGTSIKFIKAKDIAKQSSCQNNLTDGSFLRAVMGESRKRNLQTQLSKYFCDPCTANRLSIHKLFHGFRKTGADVSDVNLFFKYCSDNMDSNTCKTVSSQTIEQAGCPLWYELRYGRVTASKAYDVAHCKTLDGSLVETILGSYSLKETTAIKRGRSLEPLVLAEIRKKTAINFKKCGLLLRNDLPIFGASPDGISNDYSLEIKCPLNWNTFNTYFSSDQKPASRYMAQIQMQMYFSDKRKSIFCIAHPDFEITKDVKIVYVDYDETYCKDLIEMCIEFWSKAIYYKISV